MLRVDCSRWEQNAQTLREEALKATHPRSPRTVDGVV
jgi:hypothetical protein